MFSQKSHLTAQCCLSRQFQVQLRPCIFFSCCIYVPVNSKTAPPPPPGQSPGIWLGLSSVQWGIWPKMRPARWGIWLSYQTSVSGRKLKDFAILWFSKWAAFTGHCSCRFHVGFSVVVVLCRYIVEYVFV